MGFPYLQKFQHTLIPWDLHLGIAFIIFPENIILLQLRKQIS